MRRRCFVIAGVAALAGPALAVELHDSEWHTLGWASAARGDPVLVFAPDRTAPIWRLRLVLAGQGAIVTGLRVRFDAGPPFRHDEALFCGGQVVLKELALGQRRRIDQIEVAVSAPRDRRAIVRLFGRLG